MGEQVKKRKNIILNEIPNKNPNEIFDFTRASLFAISYAFFFTLDLASLSILGFTFFSASGLAFFLFVSFFTFRSSFASFMPVFPSVSCSDNFSFLLISSSTSYFGPAYFLLIFLFLFFLNLFPLLALLLLGVYFLKLFPTIVTFNLSLK